MLWTVLLEKTLENSLDFKEIQPSILKEISPEYSLEGLMLKLKLQYFGHLMQRTDSLEKTWCWERLEAGGEGDDRGWDGWMASPAQWTWVWANSGWWWRTGKPACCSPWGRKESDTTERLNNNNNKGRQEKKLNIKLLLFIWASSLPKMQCPPTLHINRSSSKMEGPDKL